MSEDFARRLTMVEAECRALYEQVQFLMHHQHIAGSYSEPVRIQLQPDRVISHKRDVFVVEQHSERTQPLESEHEG